MNKPPHRSHCPVNFAVEAIGDKWSLLIIRDLMFNGKSYYNDFLHSEENIATNILADRLTTLEKEQLIKKTSDPKNKSRYIYSLTEKGIDLLPMLIEAIIWSTKYDSKTTAEHEVVKQINEDKEKLIRDIREGIKQNIFILPKK
ncbi:helix-turn-helix transcriptional regulator [Candidatus Roizmanbacteria bacterium]|nr:helix-turn-helix transcriptional regulator [Candidatus Roizmanbacteria bacterium]